jgi:hypothetical protein
MPGLLDTHPDNPSHRFACMKADIPIAGCAHQAMRIESRYVNDTGFFPSISAVNPP